MPDAIEHFLWRLRHPSIRRCSSCRLTWEPRRMMATQGGVCHDCFAIALGDPREPSA